MKKSLTARNAVFLTLVVAFSSSAIAQTDLPHPTYTWSLNPVSGDWNTAANWRPQGVPDIQSEKAAFGPSSVTDVTASSLINLGSLTFTRGAGQYTINGGF